MPPSITDLKPIPRFKPRELKTPEDVIKQLMEYLDMRIADFGLVIIIAEVLTKNPKLLEAAPEDVKLMLRDPNRQIASLKEVHQLLFDLLIERKTLAAVDRLTGDQQR